MHFAIDPISTAVVIVLVLILVVFRKVLLPHTFSPPTLIFSCVRKFSEFSSWRTHVAPLPRVLHFVALSCLLLAFVDPHLMTPLKSTTVRGGEGTIPSTRGIALYLVLDRSGSMSERVEGTNESGKKVTIPKIDLLKQVTKQFILQHPSDLIGLVTFARVPEVVSPLTLDHTSLLSELQEIEVVKRPDDDGTAMGYAIYKTAHLLYATRQFADKPNRQGNLPFTIESAAIIVVTDGFQDPSRLDRGNALRMMELDDAAAFAKKENIRLYVINIDPSLSTAKYGAERRQLQSIAKETGGEFFLTSDAETLADIYGVINGLEKGKISSVKNTVVSAPEWVRQFSLYPYLLAFGGALLLFAYTLDSTLLRRVP